MATSSKAIGCRIRSKAMAKCSSKMVQYMRLDINSCHSDANAKILDVIGKKEGTA